MLYSLWLFLKGTFKRWFVWVPAVLLAPLGVYDTFIKDKPPSGHSLDFLSEALVYGYLILGLLAVLGACHAFHELRSERDELRSKLEKREARRQKAERLAGMVRQAKELAQARVTSELEWLSWIDAYGDWTRSTTEQIEGYFMVSDSEAFKNTAGAKMGDILGAYSPEHNESLLELGKYVNNLQKLMDRYED